MRSKILLVTAILLFSVLAMVGNYHQRELPGFPDDSSLITLIQERSPATFWQKIGTLTARGELDSALAGTVLRRFDKLAASTGMDDRASIDAVRAIFFFRLKNYEQATVLLRHVIATSRSPEETAHCQSLLAEITKIHHPNTMQPDKPLNIDQPAGAANSTPDGKTMFFLVLWVLLLLFPAAVLNVEKHTWLARYSSRTDRRGPFIAFIYSPMCNILLVVSASILLLLSVPQQLGIEFRFAFLTFHLMVSWFLSQIPLHSIESLVKKNSTGLLSYCREQLTLGFVRHLTAISAIITLVVLHNMVVSLPTWPITRSLGAAVAPVVFFASILLLLQFLLPWLLLLKKWKPAESESARKNRIYTAGNGCRQGIVEIGALSGNATSLIFGGMENHLARENLKLLLDRSSRKFSAHATFNDFLLIISFVSGISILPAISPIFWARLFGAGPYFIEALALLSAAAFCGILSRALERQQQKEVDTGFVAENRGDLLLSSLEIINKLNFFPDNMREGEHSEFDPLTLDESRVNLRAATGMYLPATSRPDGLVLVSLWRGRLALDWKLGHEEAIFLTSLDYQINASDTESELCALAAKHNRLGAECIYLSQNQQLKIVFCSQKFSAFTAETPLPQDKICQICSEAMIKASHFGPYKWESTPEGCLLAAEIQTRSVL
ncbi:MAG TPA: hypothetical protein DCG57_17585 [Candidatus Riflebacteria bacterium]|jgi:hypothetical protein|nr:hypothetical protein [Candidatus Riflebacteria bacterium]